jgi:hypothetical protein
LLIGDQAAFASESDGFATGTEGAVKYQVETVDSPPRPLGTVRMDWTNPFIGSNAYRGTATPPGRPDDSGGFSCVWIGGNGNDARVTFFVANGFIETDDEHTEIIDSVSKPVIVPGSPMPTPTERYAAIWEQRGGPPFQARHGLTADQYQQTFDQLLAQGFRPVRISGYAVDGQDRYAAVWEQRSGPPFQARHGLTADQYQQTFDQLLGQGFRLVHVSGHHNGQDTYAAIWEQADGPAFQARHGLTADQYQQTFDQLLAQGFRPVHVSGHGVNGQDRYAAIWEQREGPPFQARHGLDSGQYQQTFDEMLANGFRLVHVSGYDLGGRDHYAAIWEQRPSPDWQARHGITGAHYQQTFDELVSQGFAPTCVSGYPVR